MSTLDDNLKIAQIDYTMKLTEQLPTTAELMRATHEKYEAERLKLDAERLKLEADRNKKEWLPTVLGIIAGIGTFMGGLAAIILALKH